MELLRALGALCEPPAREHSEIAAALGLPRRPQPGDYEDLFLFQLYPYASVYLGAEGMLGGEARERVAGFWRALGLAPPAEPDHLAALLGLYASVAESESGEPDHAHRVLCRESRGALLREHLLSWLPPYLAKVKEIGPPFYAAWAALLELTLESEAKQLSLDSQLPLQLREAPELQPLETSGLSSFLDQLLAPVRSGIILVREDIARAARDLDLVTRVAERRYVLRGLLEQDAGGTLRWLADEARRWSTMHRHARGLSGSISVIWERRADAAAALLAEASEVAAERLPSHA